MKALVSGLVIIAISGAVLIWSLATRSSAPARPEGPERTTHCMVWKAERGHAKVWLCGSFHLLREEDYPLPEPYGKAFAESKTLVTETLHDAAQASERQAKAANAGQWPDGESLEKQLSAPAWKEVQEACATLGLNTGLLQPMKPWKAALHMGNHTMQRLGYRPALGLESWFTGKAGTRTLGSLETQEDQLGALDSLDAATQEAMLLRTAEEVKTAKERAADMAAAWREGDTARLAALEAGTVESLPALKKALLDDRHIKWLPQLEKYLDGSDTVMVLVGSRHLYGSGSLVELLTAKGVKLTHMEYRTTRPAP